MKREKSNSGGEPDPHALGIAAAAQKAVAPDLNQSQGKMCRWWGSNDGAVAFSKYG